MDISIETIYFLILIQVYIVFIVIYDYIARKLLIKRLIS